MAEMQEIEVKYRISRPAALLRALAARQVSLSTPVRQDDQAYAEHGWTYDMSKIGRSFARLRTQSGRHLFTLKVPLANQLACIEHETEVANREQMHEAVLRMGYYPTVRIVKTRRTARIDDMALCVDDVDGLGTFLELEKVVPRDDSGEETQRYLSRFVEGLVDAADRIHETYDSLIRAQSHTIS